MSSKKGKKKAAPVESDDALIERAIAEKLKLEAELEAQKDAERVTCELPTKKQLLTYLDQVLAFNLVELVDGQQLPVTSPSGEVVWYLDENDGAEALLARKETHAGQLALGCTPLGRAFGLSEGWVTPKGRLPGPMKLQASSAMLKDVAGDIKSADQIFPPSLRKRFNKRTSPLPMWSFTEPFDDGACMPFFFDRLSMAEYWLDRTGRPREELPKDLVLTDLRVLIVRMLTKAEEWKKIKLVPSHASAEWQKQREERAKAELEAKAKAIENGDEPPPLVADDAAPPPPPPVAAAADEAAEPNGDAPPPLV